MFRLKRPSVKTIILFVSIWMALVAVIILESPGWLPRTPARWVLLIILGPPVYILLEGIGEEVFWKPFNRITGRLGEQRLTTVNKVLAVVIAIPVVILILFLAVFGVYHWIFQ